ncbi:MAG: FliO/MopB family protein [Archangium sp.]|nr:FliO/MopB family protein [Archangium sp.]
MVVMSIAADATAPSEPDAGAAAAQGVDAPARLDFDAASPEFGSELDVGGALVRTFVVLGLVVALIYLSLNVGLRKLMGVAPVGSGRVVRVLERVPLDQKHALFVVRAGNEVLLLGAADNGVQLVTKLDAAEVERIHAQGATSTGRSFLNALMQAKAKPGADVPPTPKADA